jgi:hypothetical protein
MKTCNIVQYKHPLLLQLRLSQSSCDPNFLGQINITVHLEMYMVGTPDQPAMPRVKNSSPYSIPRNWGATFWEDSLAGEVGGRGLALHPATPANQTCQKEAPQFHGI